MTIERSLECGWEGIELEFNRQIGAWQALYVDGNNMFSCEYPVDLELVLDSGDVITFDQLFDFVEDYGPDYARFTLTLQNEEFPAKIQQEFIVYSTPRRLVRTIHILPEAPDPASPFPVIEKLNRYLRGIMEDDLTPVDMSVPMQRFIPGTPLRQVSLRPRRLMEVDHIDGHYAFPLTAPDLWPGTISFHYMLDDSYLTVSPLSHGPAVKISVYGDEPDLVILHQFDLNLDLNRTQEEKIILGSQLILSGGSSMDEAIRLVSSQFSQTYPPPAQRPSWIDGAAIIEVDPKSMGSFRNIMEKLPYWRECGFDTLYLMPFHLGGYGTIDYYQIDPELGDEDDLMALVNQAHELGFHVLFDLLVNIASQKSPYPSEHPEWFYHRKDGSIMPHPAWKGCCFDPASPSFQDFLIQYAKHCCDHWGADGFRVDAVAHRGCPEDSRFPEGWRHSASIFELVGRIREAIREGNDQRILMAECFGPLQVPISDLVCYQWVIWLHWILDHLRNESFDGKTVKRLIAEHFSVMPEHTKLTVYSHTHDTVAFAGEDIEGETTTAFYTTLSLLASASMVFAGGWKMRERPQPQEKDEYRKLFTVCRELGEIMTHQVHFEEDLVNSAFFIAERPSKLGMVKIVTNFSSQEWPLVHEGEVIYSRLGSITGSIRPYDTLAMLV